MENKLLNVDYLVVKLNCAGMVTGDDIGECMDVLAGLVLVM
jgi:hypothetical protein